MKTALAKILSRTKEINGCLEWQGSFQYSGRKRDVPYPNIKYGNKVWRGNRLVYFLATGKELGELHALHTCHNTKCINPQHIRSGTHIENMQDKIKAGRDHNKQKTKCAQGHLFSKENTYIRKTGARSCRECLRKAWRKYDSRNRGKRRSAALANYYKRKEV